MISNTPQSFTTWWNEIGSDPGAHRISDKHIAEAAFEAGQKAAHIPSLRPMSEAPTDGSSIVLFLSDGTPVVGKWRNTRDGVDYFYCYQPPASAHYVGWLPIPAISHPPESPA